MNTGDAIISLTIQINKNRTVGIFEESGYE